MASKGQKLAAAGSIVLIAEPALAMMHMGGIGAIVGLAAGVATYVYADDMARAVAGEGGKASPSPTVRKSVDSHLSVGKRLLVGKSARGEEGRVDPKKGVPDIWVPPQFRLDEVLDVVHAFNARGCVYFGESVDGAIAVHLHDMYHVMDVSSSGKGKSNRFRLGMMQMVGSCKTYYINPLAASVKSVKDDREIEVWTPIYERLANKRPLKEGGDILDLMTSLVAEIGVRNEQEEARDFSWQYKPIFMFIDELPEVFARCPDAIELLDKIGRMGRQYCVFCWVASQTANVKDIGLSTASQAQFMTRIYGGGDKVSADRLMKGSIPKDAERTLQSNGAGLTLMLATGISGSEFTRAPLVTNEAMFEYLHLPAFKKSDWLVKPPNEKATRLLGEDESETLLPFTLLPSSPEHAQNAKNDDEMQGKRVKGKRVKGQNDDQILEAMDALQDEQRALTLNAIARYAGLTRHQYDDIEEVAMYYGYELERGKGRPKEA